ncbi:MAG TPA: hypothetical protein DHW45_13125 [Candidatus Latescibacteria bacterium]|nr:hypothetical protein [Candidatus Latescibacterota bacterium]
MPIKQKPQSEEETLTDTLPSVFVIGSSLTLAMHPYMQTMCQGRLAYSRKGEEPDEIALALRDLDTPQGAAGGDSSMVLAYLSELEQTDSFHPDIVLLATGGHDLRKNVELGTYQVPIKNFCKNLESIVQWFTARSIKLAWMRIGPLDEKLHNSRAKSFHRYEIDVDAYNQAAEEILKRYTVHILDFPGFTRGLGKLEDIVYDHVHFKDEIVRQQAAYVVGFLEGLAPGSR